MTREQPYLVCIKALQAADDSRVWDEARRVLGKLRQLQPFWKEIEAQIDTRVSEALALLLVVSALALMGTLFNRRSLLSRINRF